MGIVCKSESSWFSALHMVPKKKDWRTCGDYRLLNGATVLDRYPLPNMSDVSARLAGNKIFSKIDLVRGYLQIPIAESDISKTAIKTHFVVWEFLCMPFGLRNVGYTFRRMIDQVLLDISFVITYLDDILIASLSSEEHMHHLKKVFKRVSENSLSSAWKMCFCCKSHRFSRASYLSAVLNAIQSFPPPKDSNQLQESLCIINAYRRFMSNGETLLKPLYKAGMTITKRSS